MAILRLSVRLMVIVCLPPGVNGANHRCISSLKNMTKRIIVFKRDVTRDDSQRRFLQHSAAMKFWIYENHICELLSEELNEG